MHKFLVSIFCSTMLLMISCDSDTPVSTYDDQLKREIIGMWTDYQNYSVVFYKNGFYKDTIFTSTTIGTNVDTMIVVRNGKYNINNSILSETDFTFEYVYLSGNLSGIGIRALEFKISINKDIMQRQVLESFSNSKSNKNIWGDWFKQYYFCEYSKDTTNINGALYGVEHYLFIQDSTKFRKIVEYEYPFTNVDTIWIDFTYDEPILNIPAFGYYDIDVKFENDKMIWYFNSDLSDLVKIK